jgi:hypothetical protein
MLSSKDFVLKVTALFEVIIETTNAINDDADIATWLH